MQFSEVIELANNGSRTEDVQSNATFQALMISPSVITKMAAAGYRYPSPVQEKAIPAALSGLDILVQAKSGTGKTLVFSVMAVENLNTQLHFPQRLIVAPTREIAIQIKDTVKRLQPVGCKTTVLVGGTNLGLDKQNLKKGTHIVIGTTGRICQLIQEKVLNLDHVELFVMDEADKMMDSDFQKDINFIFSSLPNMHRQVAVFSATYPRNLDETLGNYMKNATLIRLNSDDVQLVGIKQYASVVFGSSAIDKAISIFKNVIFKQALVFCNTYLECEPICNKLKEAGLDSAYISAQISQSERLQAIEKLKCNALKILVSTDLTARGIDATNVNLVINIGSAIDAETYFHRIGRAARFGGQGASITLLEDGRSVAAFSSIVSEGGIKAKLLDLNRLPTDLTTSMEYSHSCIDFLPNKNEGKPNIYRIKQVKRVQKEVTTQIFTFPVNKCNTGSSYDREEILSIRDNIPRLSTEFEQRLRNLKVSNVTFNNEVEDLAAQIINCAKEPINQKEQEPKKFKFVPSREKAKKKFYMRGELLAVRDSYSSVDWLNYAKTKFDFEKEPWDELLVLPDQKTQQQFDNLLDSLLDGITDTPSLPTDDYEQESDHDSIPENIPLITPQYSYDRYHMINIQKAWSSEQWLKYVKKNWNTNEDPFVIDPKMRCSVAQQLRVQREKEKQDRIMVMKEREAIRLENELLSSSRSVRNTSIEEDSWEEYHDNVFKAFVEFQGSQVKPRGAVVPIRNSPAIWAERVDFYAKEVLKLEANFAKDVKFSSGSFLNQETNTEIEILPEIFKKMHIDSNHDTEGKRNDAIIEDSSNGSYDEDHNTTDYSMNHESLLAKNSVEEDSTNVCQKQVFASVYDRYFDLLRMYCKT